MSLGLDALNKLQRMRAETAAVRTPVVLPSAALARPQTNRLLVAVAIVSLGLATAALFRSRERAPEVRIVREPAAAAFAPLTAPVRALSFTQPPPVIFSTTPAAAAPQAKARTAPTPAPAARTRAPAPSPLIASFIAKAVVGGVDDGASGGRPVVMLNDSLYHLNDMVNSALGVRLIGIKTSRLTFQDTHGLLYVRNLFPL